jgi:hypothetical protein
MLKRSMKAFTCYQLGASKGRELRLRNDSWDALYLRLGT